MLTINYGVGAGATYDRRHQFANKCFQRDCRCELCVEDRNTSAKSQKARAREYSAANEWLDSQKAATPMLSDETPMEPRLSRRQTVTLLKTVSRLHSVYADSSTSFNPVLAGMIDSCIELIQIGSDIEAEMSKQTIEACGVVIRGREARSRGIAYLESAPQDCPFRSLPKGELKTFRSAVFVLLMNLVANGKRGQAVYWMRGLAWTETKLTGSLYALLREHGDVTHLLGDLSEGKYKQIPVVFD
jgi:hypothetical protein